MVWFKGTLTPVSSANLTTAPDNHFISNGRLFSKSIAVDARILAGSLVIESQRLSSNDVGKLIPVLRPKIAVSRIIS